MIQLVKLLCLIGVFVIHGSRAQEFDNCLEIANCFIYFEGDCTVDGTRNVCLSWANLAGCAKDITMDADTVCYENNFGSRLALAVNTQLCTSPTTLVPGGTMFSFGIDDGPRNAFGTSPGSINILGYPNNPATCSDYDNVCAAGGNNDISLTFRVSDCPVATTTPAPMTTTTLMPGCECDPWIDWTPCSATCDYGTREQRRTCRNCPANTPLIQFVQCHVPRSCSVNGIWGGWMPWTTCTATCGNGGTQSRSRVCNNPPPSGPHGLSCPGSATQSQICPGVPHCPIPTPPPPPPPGNTKRECRRAAKRNCPSRRRGRQCRKRFIRNCLNNGL